MQASTLAADRRGEMLATQHRRLYSECFRAPTGYVFECAVGTTFTLDFEAFLFVPIALSSTTLADPDAVLHDPVWMLEAIHRVGDRLTVFCEDGRANAPAFRHGLLSLLEDSFVPVRARADFAIFHPKLWLIRFRNGADQSVLLRAVILSRNLSASRCWDTLVSLEGIPNPKQVVADSHDLASLVRALPELVCRGRLSDERKQQIEELASDAERTPFFAPEPFDTGTRASFVALGLDNQRIWNPGKGGRILGISPFLSDDALRWLAKLGPDRILVSREETLDSCDRAALADWRCFGLHDAAGTDAQVGESESVDRSCDVLHGLHAKALAVENGSRTAWWLGSANLTSPVKSGTNVEFLVRLEGRTRDVGIDKFLKSGFESLLRPYDIALSPTPTPPDQAQALVDQAQQLVVRSALQVECAESEAGGWSLRLGGDLRLLEGTTVTLWPLTLPQGHAQRWTGNPVEFRGLTIETLTAFFVFRIEATMDGRTASATFTCKLPVTGFPSDRAGMVVRSVIRNRGDFLNYLRRLLADVGGTARDLAGGEPRRREGSVNGGRSEQTDAVLLEGVVRALRRSPERLRAIDRTIERLRSSNDDYATQKVLPPDLLEFWSIVRELIPARDDHERTGDPIATDAGGGA